jgi:hypothetical protein
MSSLFDDLVAAIEGQLDVTGDIATLRLEAVVARLGKLSPEQLGLVIEQLDGFAASAQADLRAVEVRHAEARTAVDDWSQRASTNSGRLADEARERAASYAGVLESLDEERAEYQATYERLEAIRALVMRVKTW